MKHPLCGKYGFDKRGRQSRLRLMGLGEADQTVAGLFHEQLIKPNLDVITENFYAYLQTQPETAAFISGKDQLRRLKLTHRDYLLSLGQDFSSVDYFESRLRAGQAHALIGLPLHLYQAAYRLLMELIIGCIRPWFKQDVEQGLALIQFTNRITALDMSLVIEIYHTSTVNDLVSSIDNLLGKTQKLSTRIQHDELTTLYSRQYVLDAMQQQLASVEEAPHPFCVAMLDLDHFKKVNDKYGHLIGDRVLQDVAARIETMIRGQDTVGRYGGEEFLLILPYIRLAPAQNIAERIRQHVSATPIHVEDRDIVVSISIGLTEYQPGDSMDSLIDRADDALYMAKEQGRNRVVSQ